MTTDNWKSDAPPAAGLYIASTNKRADYVRWWNGKYWSAPTHVGDVGLPGRLPDGTWDPAQTYSDRKIQWLEAVTIDADGFISWGGLQDVPPVPPDTMVEFRIFVTGRFSHSLPQLAKDIPRWNRAGLGGDIVAYRVVGAGAPRAANEGTITPAQIAASSVTITGVDLGKPLHTGIGDVNSNAKGSGARYNTGKPDMALIPLEIIGHSYLRHVDDALRPYARALIALGEFQQTHDQKQLYEVLSFMGLHGWEECAFVFEYGAGKYAPWNWAKGMKWSVPLACAARHLLAVLRGEAVDPESGKAHRGHVFCNVVMLLTFHVTYPEGNDLPTQWLESAA